MFGDGSLKNICNVMQILVFYLLVFFKPSGHTVSNLRYHSCPCINKDDYPAYLTSHLFNLHLQYEGKGKTNSASCRKISNHFSKSLLQGPGYTVKIIKT